MSDDNMVHVEGLQRIDCRDCGQYLGFQSEGTPILWEEWRHTRCPERLAQQWEMTREQVETLTQNVQATLGVSFVDLLPTDSDAAVLRTRIGAEHVLEFLARRGYKVSEQA
jgi:hypothetical protein